MVLPQQLKNNSYNIMVNNMVMMEKYLEQAHKLGAMQAMLIMKVVIFNKY